MDTFYNVYLLFPKLWTLFYLLRHNYPNYGQIFRIYEHFFSNLWNLIYFPNLQTFLPQKIKFFFWKISLSGTQGQAFVFKNFKEELRARID